MGKAKSAGSWIGLELYSTKVRLAVLVGMVEATHFYRDSVTALAESATCLIYYIASGMSRLFASGMRLLCQKSRRKSSVALECIFIPMGKEAPRCWASGLILSSTTISTASPKGLANFSKSWSGERWKPKTSRINLWSSRIRFEQLFESRPFCELPFSLDGSHFRYPVSKSSVHTGTRRNQNLRFDSGLASIQSGHRELAPDLLYWNRRLRPQLKPRLDFLWSSQ